MLAHTQLEACPNKMELKLYTIKFNLGRDELDEQKGNVHVPESGTKIYEQFMIIYWRNSYACTIKPLKLLFITLKG